MPTALRKRTITAPATPDATETVRGSGSLVTDAKLGALLLQLRNLGSADAPQTNELLTLRGIGEALEYLLTQPMPVAGVWEFANAVRLGAGANKILRTNGTGLVTGVETLPAGMIEGLPESIPAPLQDRGGLAGQTAFPAQATGQTGSGTGGTIARGDFWTTTAAMVLSGVAAPINAMVVSLRNSPNPTLPADWLVVRRVEVASATPVADPKLQSDLFLSGTLAGNSGLSVLGWAAGGTERHRRGSEGRGITGVTAAAQYANKYLYAETAAAKSKISLTEKWRFAVRVETPTQFFCHLGITATAGGFTVNNGLYFIAEAGDPNWRIAAKGAAETIVNTTIPINGLCNEFEIHTGNVGSVQYYINGILAGTITTNIPLATQDFYPIISIAPNEAVEKRLTLYEYSRTLK